MSPKLALALIIIPAIAFAAIGCGGDGDDDEPATPTTVETPAPTPPSGPTTEPLSQIEQIIAAAEANDIEALRDFLVFVPTACETNVQGAGGPPDCRPGEPDGTLVPVLAIADCEGHYSREDEVTVEPLSDGAIEFVGAYAAPAAFFPEGETVLLFTRELPGIPRLGLQLVLTGESISGLRYGCGITAEEMIDLHELGEPIEIG